MASPRKNHHELMSAPAFLSFARVGDLRGRSDRGPLRAVPSRAMAQRVGLFAPGPIGRPSVVVMETGFVIACQGRRTRPIRAFLDQLLGEIHEDLSLAPADAMGPVWREQYPPAGALSVGVDDQIPDVARLIVHDEIEDVANSLVASLDVIPKDGACPPFTLPNEGCDRCDLGGDAHLACLESSQTVQHVFSHQEVLARSILRN